MSKYAKTHLAVAVPRTAFPDPPAQKRPQHDRSGCALRQSKPNIMLQFECLRKNEPSAVADVRLHIPGSCWRLEFLDEPAADIEVAWTCLSGPEKFLRFSCRKRFREPPVARSSVWN